MDSEESQFWVYGIDEESMHIGGILRSVIPFEIFRQGGLLEFANYIRKLKGILQITNPSGSPEDELAAETALKNAAKHNAIITPSDLEFRLNQITGGSNSSFSDFLEYCDRSISIAVLGQADASDLGKHSSRAAIQIQRLISADIMYADMARTEALCNVVLKHFCKLNYGLEYHEPLPFAFRFNHEEDRSPLDQVRIVKEILDTKLPVYTKELYAKLGLTMPPDTADIMQGA